MAASVLSLAYGPDRALALAGKRLLDFGLGPLALIVLAPVMAIVALAVLIVDGRPVMFRQARVGLHGRPFKVASSARWCPMRRFGWMGSRAERDQGPRVQGHQRPAADADRPVPAGDQPRRAAPDLERRCAAR